MREANARSKLLQVVLIDDEPDEIFFAVHALQKAGVEHPVATFQDPTAALDHLKNAASLAVDIPAAAIFCDVKMPGLSGFEVVRALREMPKMQAVPIWMMSGSDADCDLVEAKASGADGYIVKPAIPLHLATIVRGEAIPARAGSSAVPFKRKLEAF